MAMTDAATPTRSLLSISKRRAFLIHLSASAFVVGTLCAIIFFLWYPAPYFEARGAWSVIRILVGVDLILGPALTLVLFRPRKTRVAVRSLGRIVGESRAARECEPEQSRLGLG